MYHYSPSAAIVIGANSVQGCSTNINLSSFPTDVAQVLSTVMYRLWNDCILYLTSVECVACFQGVSFSVAFMEFPIAFLELPAEAIFSTGNIEVALK